MKKAVTLELMEVGFTRHFGALVGLGGWGRVRFPALAALIRHPAAGNILFDTGYGTRVVQGTGLALPLYRRLLPVGLPADQRIDRQLVARGVAPDSLSLIVLSHVHPDHIGGLGDLPARPLLWPRAARDAFVSGSVLSRFHEATFSHLAPGPAWASRGLIEDCRAVDISRELPGFETGFDLIGDRSLVAVPLPGHARGQTGLLCSIGGGRRIFLIADAAWIAGNITDGIEPSRLLDRIAHDSRAYHDTLARLRHLHRQRPEIIMIPSHCMSSFEAWRRDLGR